MDSDYFLPGGYDSRPAPAYFDDVHEQPGVVWQPDVYATAGRIATALGAPTLIDIGCGSGDKLAGLPGRFARIGLDFGANASRAAQKAGMTVHHHDLDSETPWPIDREAFAGAVIVSSDVIEHLRHPEHLVAGLVGAMEAGARCVIVSTPDRELVFPSRPLGPPANPCHVREWSRVELGLWLASKGLPVRWCLPTRTVSSRKDFHTSLAVALSPELAEVVAPVLPASPSRLDSWLVRCLRNPVADAAYCRLRKRRWDSARSAS